MKHAMHFALSAQWSFSAPFHGIFRHPISHPKSTTWCDQFCDFIDTFYWWENLRVDRLHLGKNLGFCGISLSQSIDSICSLDCEALLLGTIPCMRVATTAAWYSMRSRGVGLLAIFFCFVKNLSERILMTYCGWLRNPKSTLHQSRMVFQAYMGCLPSTGAGFRNHPRNLWISGWIAYKLRSNFGAG